MPYRAEAITEARLAPPSTSPVATSDWRTTLPVLRGLGVTLRALELSDAPSLFALLTAAEVTRFISPPPTAVEGFERFIAWTHRQQAEGRLICFGIVPDGCRSAVGIIQVRALDSSFSNAEWGFALGSMYWGTGIFQEGAIMAIHFAFDHTGVTRLEARASVANGRGNGALRKVGAVEEARLRKSFARDGVYSDQILWSILKEDWAPEIEAKTVWGVRIH
jgi:RimJ/RimL family protein N-acetyltransferase